MSMTAVHPLLNMEPRFVGLTLCVMFLITSLAGCLSDGAPNNPPLDTPGSLELVHFDSSIELPTGAFPNYLGMERETHWTFKGETRDVAGPKGPVEDAWVVGFDDGEDENAVHLHPETLEPVSLQFLGQSRVQMIPPLDWPIATQFIQFLPFRRSSVDLAPDGKGQITFVGYHFDYEYQGENRWLFTTPFEIVNTDSGRGGSTMTWEFLLHPDTVIPTDVDLVHQSSIDEKLRTTDIQIEETDVTYTASVDSHYSDSPYYPLKPWDVFPPEEENSDMPWRLAEALEDARELNDQVDDFLDRNPDIVSRYAEFTQRSPFPVGIDTTAWRFTWYFVFWGDEEVIEFRIDWWNPVLPQMLSNGHKEVNVVEERQESTVTHKPPTRDPILTWDEAYGLCSDLTQGHDRTITFYDHGHDKVEIEVGGVPPDSKTRYDCQNINGPGFQLDANTGYFTAWLG